MRIDFLYLLTPKSHSGSLQVLPINRFSPSAPTALWAKQECSFLWCPLSYKTPHTLIYLIHNAMIWLFLGDLSSTFKTRFISYYDKVGFLGSGSTWKLRVENQEQHDSSCFSKDPGRFSMLATHSSLDQGLTACPRSSVHTEQLTPFLSTCTAAEANLSDFCSIPSVILFSSKKSNSCGNFHIQKRRRFDFQSTCIF